MIGDDEQRTRFGDVLATCDFEIVAPEIKRIKKISGARYLS
jgi:hypothetical protein